MALEKAAQEGGRSLHAEILRRLQLSLVADGLEATDELITETDMLVAKVDRIEQLMEMTLEALQTRAKSRVKKD